MKHKESYLHFEELLQEILKETYTRLECLLQSILAERLKYSREWNNVSMTSKGSCLMIRWYDPKTQTGPYGKDVFYSKKMAPLNLDTLLLEIKRQNDKLKHEQK